MKPSTFFAIISVFVATFTIAQTRKINIQITCIQPYCGGARPSAEMIAEAQQPKPFANKTIIIVSAKSKVDSAKTNNNGELVLKLKKGNYKIYESWRYYKQGAGGIKLADFDKECLKNEWKKEIKEITISKKEFKFIDKNVIVEECPWNLPCILESAKPPASE
jgi:hypothetical protein